MQTTTEWAREHGEGFVWSCALDNYEPMPRETDSGEGWRYALDDARGSGIILADVSSLKDARRAVYLIDDGRSVQPFYVAGWKEGETYLMLHPFPVNVGANGEPIKRADDGRPVDFSMWQLGPRRAYHFKVRPAIARRGEVSR